LPPLFSFPRILFFVIPAQAGIQKSETVFSWIGRFRGDDTAPPSSGKLHYPFHLRGDDITGPLFVGESRLSHLRGSDAPLQQGWQIAFFFRLKCYFGEWSPYRGTCRIVVTIPLVEWDGYELSASDLCYHFRGNKPFRIPCRCGKGKHRRFLILLDLPGVFVFLLEGREVRT